MKNFIKGSSILMFGDLITKIISVLYLIPLQRINDDIILLMTNLLVPFSFFVVLSTLGINVVFTNQLVKAKTDDEKKDILIDVAMILLVLTAVGSLLMFAVSSPLMHTIELNEKYAQALTTGSRWLILGVILFSITGYMRAILMAYGDYSIVSITYITEQIIKVSMILIGVYYTIVLNNYDVVISVYIIVISILVSMLSTLLIYSYHFVKNDYITRFKKGKYVFKKKHIKFLLYSSLVLFTGGIYITLFDQIDLLLLNGQMLSKGYDMAYINEVKSEYFTLSMKIVMVPITVSAAFVSVMIKQIGESDNSKEDINKIVYIVSIFSSLMMFGIMFMGQNAYDFLYGSKGTGIIVVQALIIPMYITKNILGGYIVTNSKKFKSILISTVIMLITKYIFDILFFQIMGIDGFIISSVVSLLIGIAILVFYNKRLFIDLPNQIMKNIIIYLKGILTLIISIFIFKNISINTGLFVTLIIQAIIYLIIFSIIYIKEIKIMFRK